MSHSFEVVSAVQAYKKKHPNKIPTIDELWFWLVRYRITSQECTCPLCKEE